MRVAEHHSYHTKFHLRMNRDYVANFINYGIVRELCSKFKDNQTDVHDADEQVCTYVACSNLVQRVNQVVRERLGRLSHLLGTENRSETTAFPHQRRASRTSN
ncbi:hypothetical protein AVEN_32930-1 [Araneus ventricosus]|uniref:Uncharacterized protein n=1 Tax=Araneus ventricosus TaxID=182803 RepID=A0A4Y2UH44_ARAVE|nr:hypothetical protein AVEN_92873-1 [Araneus ventricosus]GBO19384.1 hypothetical protein AVEN_32930-1 [Araneus ventricosus]